MLKPYTNRATVKTAGCAISFTPPAGYQWEVVQIAVNNNGAAIPTVLVYVDTTFICGSNAGNRDSADGSPVPVNNGSSLTVLWTLATNGSISIAQIIVQETPI